jgi:hypothetical protein
MYAAVEVRELMHQFGTSLGPDAPSHPTAVRRMMLRPGGTAPWA